MRCRHVAAGNALAALMALPEQTGRPFHAYPVVAQDPRQEMAARNGRQPDTHGPFGKEAEKLSMEQVLRIESCARRAQEMRGPGMSLPALIQMSARKRRARQTHPGKR